MSSRPPNRPNAKESELLDTWARLGNADELKRICKDILARPRQGYAVAFEAQHIISAHTDYWRSEAPIEAAGSRANRALLTSAPKVVRRVQRALREMIDLHLKSEKRRWYGREIVGGAMQRGADGSWANSPRPWTRFPRLYAQTLKALDTDPLWETLRDTPTDMWLIPPRGNPKKRRNGALTKALRHVGLTKKQIDDVIHAVGWSLR